MKISLGLALLTFLAVGCGDKDDDDKVETPMELSGLSCRFKDMCFTMKKGFAFSEDDCRNQEGEIVRVCPGNPVKECEKTEATYKFYSADSADLTCENVGVPL